MICTSSKGSDQTAQMYRLILAFATGICSKTHFGLVQLIYLFIEIIKIKWNLSKI